MISAKKITSVYGAQFQETRKKMAALGEEDPPVSSWHWKPFDPARIPPRNLMSPQQWPSAVQTNYRPSDKPQKVILLFEVDALNAVLLNALKRQKLKYFFVDYMQMMEQCGNIQMDLAGGFGSGFGLGQAQLRFSDVAAVIWNPPFFDEDIPRHPIADHLFCNRWSQCLRDLRAFLPKKTIWLPSHPLNGSADWQQKLSEYAYAREAGLHIPQTLCTNDPAAAKKFIDRWGGKVLFREFNSPYIFFRIAFADAREKALKKLSSSPCVFQQYIKKEYEIRAVVVGDKIFACQIDSQASELAKIDWRCYDNAHVRWDRMELPKSVQRVMLSLMKKLDLKWGSFDMIKSPDGNYYFLEVNRPGASYWLLPFVGLDVAWEITSYLKRVL